MSEGKGNEVSQAVLLEEKQPVTPVMALQLGKPCGNWSRLWLNVQERYDLHRAEQKFRSMQTKRTERDWGIPDALPKRATDHD